MFPGFSFRSLAIGVSVFCTIPARVWSHRDLSSSSASLRAMAPSYKIFWSLVLKCCRFLDCCQEELVPAVPFQPDLLLLCLLLRRKCHGR